MLGQLARVLIQVAGIVVLARLLSPEDYGLLAMVVAIVGVGEIFRDFGLSSAAIQAPTISKGQRSNLFWLNSGIGFTLAILTIVLAQPIALLYGEPRLAGICLVLSSTFLLNGIATQHKADITRQLKFRKLALIEVIAPAIGLAVGLVSAVVGFGYWSLVLQQVAIPLVAAILFLQAGRWVPQWYDKSESIRGFMKFGVNLLGAQMLTYASRNADSVVIGMRFGPASLGLYDRAFQMIALPLNQLNAPASKVALPILSRLDEDATRYSSFLLRGQSVMINMITPLLAFGASVAPAAVTIVLGAQWTESASLFQLLALGGIAQALSYATYWVFLSKGLTASNLRLTLVSRPLIVFGIIVGSNWGVQGVATAYAVGLLLNWPLGLWWISRVSDAPALGMFFNGVRALVVYGVAAVGTHIATTSLLQFNELGTAAIGLVIFLAIASLGLLWRPFRRDIAGILQLRSLLGKRK